MNIPTPQSLAGYLAVAIAAVAALVALFGPDRAWEALQAVWQFVTGGA